MKKVILISGTARSGSTLLSLMLANSPQAITVGELHYLFRPDKPMHLLKNKNCFCSDSDCKFWGKMSRAGEKQIYSKIFEEFNHLNLIVDSSKRPLWIKDQIAYSKNKEYETIVVIPYKSPLEYAYSKDKRNNLQGWKKGWIKQHRIFFNLFDDFISVRYKNLAMNPVTELKTLCKTLDIPYFKGKENFWNSDNSHLLFGSTSVARSNKLIYYDEQYDNHKLNELKNDLDFDDELLTNILKVLDKFEVSQKSKISDSVYILKNKLGISSKVSNFIYRIQSTPYYTINSLMHKLVKTSLKLRIKSS